MLIILIIQKLSRLHGYCFYEIESASEIRTCEKLVVFRRLLVALLHTSAEDPSGAQRGRHNINLSKDDSYGFLWLRLFGFWSTVSHVYVHSGG